MHTEMWEHPATQAQRGDAAATAARSWSSRPSAVSPARTPAGGACRSRPTCSTSRGSSGRPRGRLRTGPARRGATVDPRSSRSAGAVASLAGKPGARLGRGTREELDPVRFLGNWSTGPRATRSPGQRRPRGGRHPGRRQRGAARPGRGEGRPDRLGPGHARRDARRGAARGRDRDDGGGGRLPPGGARRGEDQADGTRPPPIELAENPDILADLSGAPPRARPGEPGDRGLRRRDQPGPGRGPGQAGPQGQRLPGHEPGRRRPGVRQASTTSGSCSRPTAA